MRLFTLRAAVFAAVTTLALATPAAGQMRIYEDYEPSEEVVELTMVKVEEAQLESYLNGLKSTWVAANEAQKDLGYITSFGIYEVPYGDNEFNLILRVTFPSTEMIGPSKERYLAFLDAYGKANLDKAQRTTVAIYNKIRTIQARSRLREIKFTP